MNLKELEKLSKLTGAEIIEGMGEEFGVNDWGSCQYTGALNAFNALNELTEKFGAAKTQELLGIEITHGRMRTRKEVSEIHWERQAEWNKEQLDDEKADLKYFQDLLDKKLPAMVHTERWTPTRAELPEQIERCKKRIAEYEAMAKGPVVNGDEIMEWCKSQAWDLWGAAPYVASLFFEDFEIKAAKAPGVGPNMNAIVQESNYETGAICWYLKYTCIVNNEESFAGFDT